MYPFGGYLIACVVILLAWFVVSRLTERARRTVLYGWAPYNLTFEKSGNPKYQAPARWLLKGAHRWVDALVKRAEHYELKEAPHALDWYLRSLELGLGVSESRQRLAELLDHAHKLALEAKQENKPHRFDAISAWRADVSRWADIASSLVPKLVREIQAETAAA